jgi:hypothetical protein
MMRISLLVSLGLAGWPALASGHDLGPTDRQESATVRLLELERVDQLATLDDGELIALVDTMETNADPVSHWRSAVEREYEDAFAAYLAAVVDHAAASADIEDKVASLLLVSSSALREQTFRPGFLDRLSDEALAGSALRPDLLAVVDLACGLLANPVILYPDHAPHAVPASCADQDLAARLTAIEPSNAFHWVRRFNDVARHGDPETARTLLLASGRSTLWRPPARFAMKLVHQTLSRWPPTPPVYQAARELAEDTATRHPADAIGDAYMNAWRDPETFIVTHAWGIGMLLWFSPVSPKLERCREAIAARDTALVAVCRRLGRMIVDSEDSIMDVLIGYGLLTDVESPAASARAAERREQFWEDVYAGYWTVLNDSGVAPDIVADFHDLLAHGEVEMTRRARQRLDARLAAMSGAFEPLD